MTSSSPVDLLVRGGELIATMDSDRREIPSGAVSTASKSVTDYNYNALGQLLSAAGGAESEERTTFE